MRSMHVAVAVLLLAVGTGARAQQPAAQPPNDPIGENFFPPELVMGHQQEIGLTDAQRGFIIAEVGSAQQRATQLQWTLEREIETMAVLARQDRIEEDKILAQLDRVLAAERDIKRIHLTLIVRIKNQLTPEQRVRLRQLRSGVAG